MSTLSGPCAQAPHSSLFGQKAEEERLSTDISDLLDVPVGVDDGLPEYICEKRK